MDILSKSLTLACLIAHFIKSGSVDACIVKTSKYQHNIRYIQSYLVMGEDGSTQNRLSQHVHYDICDGTVIVFQSSIDKIMPKVPVM